MATQETHPGAQRDPDGFMRCRPVSVPWPSHVLGKPADRSEVHPIGCFDCGTTLVVHRCADNRFRCGPCIHGGAPLNFR